MPLGEGKTQTNTGLDDHMRSSVDWLIRFEDSSLTVVIGAGVAALFSLPDADRKYFLKWASQIDRGLATWEGFVEACQKSTSERLAILARPVGAEPFVGDETDRGETRK